MGVGLTVTSSKNEPKNSSADAPEIAKEAIRHEDICQKLFSLHAYQDIELLLHAHFAFL